MITLSETLNLQGLILQSVYKYTATQKTAHMASDLLCANITVNNVYCPIKTVANIASVTEDQGSNDWKHWIP